MNKLRMYKSGASALALVGVLAVIYRFAVNVPGQNVSGTGPLGESGAYMLCREQIVRQSLDPDLAIVPGIRHSRGNDTSFHFAWDENSSRVGLPTLFGKTRLYNAFCVVDRSTRAVTHLSIKGYSNPQH